MNYLQYYINQAEIKWISNVECKDYRLPKIPR